MIRAITFDFWRTLFRDANGTARKELRVRAFTEATGVSVEDTLKAMDVCFREFDRCHREEQRTLEPMDAVRIMRQTLGISIAPEVERQLAEAFATAILHHSPTPIEGALEAVQAASRMRPIGVISDSGVSPGRCLRSLLERHGFLDYFKAVVFSDEVGVAKPQRLMFETAAQNLGVNPHDLLHIGDLEYSDICGAKSVGAKAALFTGDNATYAGKTTADYSFETWNDFLKRLPDLCRG